ncbi:MAG: hypothetical protein AB8F78_02190 [Saprospiraceae bacterium]
MIIHVIGTLDTAQVTVLTALAKARSYEIQQVDVNSEEAILPPLWETDALILVDWIKDVSTVDARFIQWVELIERCGRPMLFCEADEIITQEQFIALSLKPRTNYQPVDCGYYDHFEAAIGRRQTQRIRLTCFGKSGETSAIQQLKLLGTKTWRKEEFVEVEGAGWMRADWVEMVDVSVDGSCSI